MATPSDLVRKNLSVTVDFASKPPPTPLTIRLLREMDEDIWMSGSELKTDNSSSCCSDAEESSTKQIDKMRKRTKRRTRSTKSYFDDKSGSDNKLSVTLHQLSQGTSKTASDCLKTDIVHDDEDETVDRTPTWRPKRGSIASLPGLIDDLEKIAKI